MSDRNLSAHHIEEIIEIGAMVYVGQQLPIHLLHLRPVRPVHISDVEIVALVAPAFVEDLLELLLGIEIHPQRDIDASLARLRRAAIGINYEKRRHRRRRARDRGSTTSGASRAIKQLASVRTHYVSRHAGCEAGD